MCSSEKKYNVGVHLFFLKKVVTKWPRGSAPTNRQRSEIFYREIARVVYKHNQIDIIA